MHNTRGSTVHDVDDHHQKSGIRMVSRHLTQVRSIFLPLCPEYQLERLPRGHLSQAWCWISNRERKKRSVPVHTLVQAVRKVFLDQILHCPCLHPIIPGLCVHFRSKVRRQEAKGTEPTRSFHNKHVKGSVGHDPPCALGFRHHSYLEVHIVHRRVDGT